MVAGVPLFGEAVALGKRLHVEGADPIDQAVEVFANSRLGPSAVGRFNQQVEGPIELLLRRLGVAEGQLVPDPP